ncbi:MAG TPA: adenylate/guanylate cyclase domain-containing protein [Anaerolineales bacterium]|nr:adenylate/guanylate cyclase domain-containing protein [Anaerolineales bacterium]
MDLSNKQVNLEERELLEQAIAVLETRRSLLGDDIVDAAITSMREKLAGLKDGTRATREPQQRKLITVLFADVSGFTAMAETMDHEVVSDVINSLWSRVDRAIIDHGGRIDKHIGDAIMALYGTPTAHEDDPERAIRSALQIQSEIMDWKDELSKSLPGYKTQIQNIQLRIGINAGPALLGTVGMTNEYTAIGDTVNLASRLETAAPRGEILISHETHQLVRGVFNVTELDPITVKGKSEPIPVFTVQSVKPRSFRDTTRGLEGIETRTIGREKELAQMKAVLEETIASKETHLITLVAEAGTGKSRLLFEFGKWLEASEKAVQILKGRAVQESTHTPYSLLHGIVSSLFDINENDRAAIARQKLELGIQKKSSDTENATQHAHFIGHLIGLDYSESPYLKGILADARQIRDRAFHYATQLFADLTLDTSLVIFLEDIHWADTGSLDFFESFAEKQPDLPILIVSLTRATLFEQRPDWGTGTVQTLRLDLLPLSEKDTRRLISEILQKVPDVPEPIMELIVNKAEGSPFYVEELIKVLIEGGVIVRGEEQGSVELKRLSNLKVPPTLTGLLQARLDGLIPNVRETLQQASVVGRVFWMDIIEHMRNPEIQYAENKERVKDRLRILHSKELIYPYEESASKETFEYIFKNQILHDVTYESVLLRLRPLYHSQAAEGLVDIGGERINEFAGRVGEHFERAEEWVKAAEWYIRAGRQAQNTYASDSAIHFYQKALDFLNKHGDRDQLRLKLDVLQQLGEVFNWQARYTEAVELYSIMLKEAETSGDGAAQARALLSLSASLSYQGDHQASLENAIRAETLAESAHAKFEIAKALRGQGNARFRLGEAQAALFLAEKSLDMFTELGAQNEMARCLNLLAAVHYVSGRLNDAELNWEKSLKIFQELGNRQEGMDLLSNLGVVADGLGDYETAFKRYDNALTIAREIGYRDGEIVFLTNRGSEYVALGNYEAAEADLRQAIQLAGITGSWCMPLTFNQRAEALIGLGRYDEAFYSARQALVLGEEDETPEYIGMVWRTMGMICDRTDDVVRFSDWETHQMGEYDAESCFSKSANIFVESEIELEHAHTLREWARYRFKSGDKKGGKKMWQEARDIFTDLGAQMEVERMKDQPE